MSIMSSICAETHRGIVKQAVDIERDSLDVEDSYSFEDVIKILDRIQKYCDYHIAE